MDTRASLGPERLHLGWQCALLHPDPGPPPKRPTPPEQHRVHPEWMQAQRREESQLNRPLKLVGALALGMAVFFGLLGWPFDFVPGWGAAVAIGVCLVLAGVAAYAIWQGEQALRGRMSEERERLERLRQDRERRLRVAQEDHARRFDAWRERKAAYDAQFEWYAVTLPRKVARLEVAGGTLPGWQALTTMMGASCLDTGGQVTVVDLSEGAVASDLLQLAAGRGPQVWTLPQDLSQLHLGESLDAEPFSDILSLAVSVAEEQGAARDNSVDASILERLLDILDGRASIAQITAALRALAQIGDVHDDVDRGLVSREQLERITRTFGRGASERIVYERAWALESQLRKLDPLGSTAGSSTSSPLRVVSLARQGGILGTSALGTYVITALLHELRGAPRREPWSRSLFVCGAEKLRGDVLDRLYEACEATGTGLVATYRSIPSQVRERLGRGNSAVAFMRMDSAEDAKVAAEQIGPEHRFILNQLTETVGKSVPDIAGDAYPSIRGASDSRAAGGDILAEGVDATSWGRTTSQAVGGSESISSTLQHSREISLDQRELQRLPASAFILSQHPPGGRQVVLGDANPAIVSLPQATRRELEEVRREADRAPELRSPAQQQILPHPSVAAHQPGASQQWRTDTFPAQEATALSTPASPPASPPAPVDDSPPPVRSRSGEGHVRVGPDVRPSPSPKQPETRSSPKGRRAGRNGSGAPSRAPDAADGEGAGGEGTGGDATAREHTTSVRESVQTEKPSREELEDLPPNLGPPPERLDWRKGR